MFDDIGEIFSEINPMVFLTAAVGLLMGIAMLKFGGLHGMKLIGKLGLIIGSTIGGFIAGLIFLRE